MTFDDFMTIYRVLHATDHTAKANLEVIASSLATPERLSTWIDGNLESAGALVDRLVAAVDSLGGFFDEPPSGSAELRESLLGVRAKIDHSINLAKQARKKPKVKRIKVGDKDQEIMFDADDPAADDATGDPG